MARDCILIRALDRGPAEENLARVLREYFGRHVYFVLDRYLDQTAEARLANRDEVLVGGRFLHNYGIPTFKRLGWQCGDLCLYAAVKTIPYYDYYWMIEPDVSITLDSTSWLFEVLSENKDDFIGSNFGPRSAKWRWSKTMARESEGGTFGPCFPLSRFSFSAVQYLFEKRVKYFGDPLTIDSIMKKQTRLVANDESFVATTLAHGGFACRSLAKLYPKIMSHFSATIPIHIDEVPFLREKILHPVCGDDRFARKFSRMRASNPALAASRMEEFLLCLGEDSWVRATSISPAEVRSQMDR